MYEWREDELIGYDEQNLKKVRKLGDLKKGRRRKAWTQVNDKVE